MNNEALYIFSLKLKIADKAREGDFILNQIE